MSQLGSSEDLDRALLFSLNLLMSPWLGGSLSEGWLVKDGPTHMSDGRLATGWGREGDRAICLSPTSGSQAVLAFMVTGEGTSSQASWTWVHNLLVSHSVQFSRSVVSDSLRPHGLCCTPGLPVHHQHLEFTQTHDHWVSDAIQPSHPLSSPSPPAFSLAQHQGFFKRVSSLHHVDKVLEFQLQHLSFQRIFRTDFH